MSGLRTAAIAFALTLWIGGPFTAASARPNLVVLIVAEQFRADYLDRYAQSLSAGGFNRLLSQGAVFPRSRFDHAVTLGAPNAAVLVTGAYPELHGIIADRWYERRAKKLVAAVEGDRVGGVSKPKLVGSTIADQLRLATLGRSRVVAVSDRAAPALLLAGRRPFGCYWKDAEGRFTSGGAQSDSLPEWVQAFNALNSTRRYAGYPWRAVDALPDSLPLRVLHLGTGAQRDGFRALYRSSPFAAEEIFALAQEAIQEEALGRRGHPDLLIINLSAPALLALETGAYSPLMRDMVLRIDRMIAAFLATLDEQIGLHNAAVVFTALHGTPPLPESLRKEGLPAGRVAGAAVVDAMNEALAARFGPDVFVEKYVWPFVYLSAIAGKRQSARRREIIAAAGEAAMGVTGVAAYYAPGLDSAPSALRGRLERSWNPVRSGDLMLVYEPFFTEDYGPGRGTTSGSPYRYDTDVPLIFLGAAFKADRFEAVADAASVAPTLAAVLGISAPSSATGRILTQALVPRPKPESWDPAFVGPQPPK